MGSASERFAIFDFALALNSLERACSGARAACPGRSIGDTHQGELRIDLRLEVGNPSLELGDPNLQSGIGAHCNNSVLLSWFVGLVCWLVGLLIGLLAFLGSWFAGLLIRSADRRGFLQS